MRRVLAMLGAQLALAPFAWLAVLALLLWGVVCVLPVWILYRFFTAPARVRDAEFHIEED